VRLGAKRLPPRTSTPFKTQFCVCIRQKRQQAGPCFDVALVEGVQRTKQSRKIGLLHDPLASLGGLVLPELGVLSLDAGVVLACSKLELGSGSLDGEERLRTKGGLVKVSGLRCNLRVESRGPGLVIMLHLINLPGEVDKLPKQPQSISTNRSKVAM
jgi:hypothetical protein